MNINTFLFKFIETVPVQFPELLNLNVLIVQNILRKLIEKGLSMLVHTETIIVKEFQFSIYYDMVEITSLGSLIRGVTF